MSLAETAVLAVNMNLGGNFISKMSTATGQLDKFNAKADTAYRIGTHIGMGIQSLATNVIKIGAVALGAIGVGVKQGISSLSTLQSGIDANEAAIKQMGLTGQVTAKQIAGWASDIEKAVGSAFDDKDINAAATTLLRFGKTAPQNLRPALQVVTDLATKTGSVESAATLLAKALADPEKAAGKLARSGVVLTKSQQKQIDLFIKQGKVAQAQKVILDALAATTAGAALASQDKFARSGAILKDVMEDAERALATGSVPVIEKVRDLLSTELAKPSTLKNIEAFGNSLAGGLQSLIDTARGLPWDAIGTGVGNAAAGIKGIFDAFMGLPPDTKNLLIGLAALNKLSGGAVIKIGVDILQGVGGGLLQQFIGKGSPANPMFVVPLGGGGLGGAGGAGGTGLLAAGLRLLPWVAIASTAAYIGANFIAANQDPRIRQQTYGTGNRTGSTAPGRVGNFARGVIPADRMTPIVRIDPRNLSEGNKEIVDAEMIVRDRIESNRIALVSGQRDSNIRLDNLDRAVRASRGDVTVNVTTRTSVTTDSVTRQMHTAATYSTSSVGMRGAILGAG